MTPRQHTGRRRNRDHKRRNDESITTQPTRYRTCNPSKAFYLPSANLIQHLLVLLLTCLLHFVFRLIAKTEHSLKEPTALDNFWLHCFVSNKTKTTQNKEKKIRLVCCSFIFICLHSSHCLAFFIFQSLQSIHIELCGCVVCECVCVLSVSASIRAIYLLVPPLLQFSVVNRYCYYYRMRD